MAPQPKKNGNTAQPKTEPKQVNAPPKTTNPEAETKDLARASSPAALVNGAPDWLVAELKGRAPLGLDKMDNADMILPRLVLAQALTPEVVNAGENGLGIAVGDIFDNLSKQVLCKAGDKLQVIPVVLGKSRFHLAPYDSDGKSILCRSDDAQTARPGGDGVDMGGKATSDCNKCIRKEFDEETGKPDCSLFYNIVVLLPEFGMQPFIWSMKHTNVKVAKRFLSTARQTRADLFAQRYAIFSETEKSEKYTFKNYNFAVLGWVSQAEYLNARGFYLTNIEGKTWAPDTSDLNEEAAAPSGESEVSTEFPPANVVDVKPTKSGPEEDAF